MDLNELKELLQILDEKEIMEFELEEEGMKLRIRKAAANHAAPPATLIAPLMPGVLPAAAMVSPPPAPVPASPLVAGEAQPEPAPEVESDVYLAKSPIVGTFYRAPDPNSPSFVNVGDQVRKGQVLCIIEAMKLMNEIEAEVAGTIIKVHLESGQTVQYGDPLFSIRTD